MRGADDAARERRRAARQAGMAAEAEVARRLQADGWAVLARNWRAPPGELDIVAERAGMLRVVEVKLRDLEDPRADDAIPSSKRSKLRATARAWLTARGEPEREVAFMVAWVELDGEGMRVTLMDDAFEGGAW